MGGRNRPNGYHGSHRNKSERRSTCSVRIIDRLGKSQAEQARSGIISWTSEIPFLCFPASRYWRAIHSPITRFLLPGPDTGLGLGEGKPDMLGRMRLEPYLLQLKPILQDHYYDHSIPVL